MPYYYKGGSAGARPRASQLRSAKERFESSSPTIIRGSYHFFGQVCLFSLSAERDAKPELLVKWFRDIEIALLSFKGRISHRPILKRQCKSGEQRLVPCQRRFRGTQQWLFFSTPQLSIVVVDIASKASEVLITMLLYCNSSCSSCRIIKLLLLLIRRRGSSLTFPIWTKDRIGISQHGPYYSKGNKSIHQLIPRRQGHSPVDRKPKQLEWGQNLLFTPPYYSIIGRRHRYRRQPLPLYWRKLEEGSLSLHSMLVWGYE